MGQPNPYGHPNPNALAEAESTGADIWRTDEHGTLTITWDTNGDPIVTGETVNEAGEIVRSTA